MCVAEFHCGAPADVAGWSMEPDQIGGLHRPKMTLFDRAGRMAELVGGEDEAVLFGDPINCRGR